MKDYGISVLTQYQMEVFGTHKVRGAILCDTDKGLLLCLIKRMLMSVKPRMEQAIS